MSTRKRTRFAAIIGGTLCVAAALTMASSAASPRFYGDDPVWREPDTQDASAMKPLDVDLLADLATNLVGPLLPRGCAAVNRAERPHPGSLL